MEFIKLTAKDGARVEVNPDNILYVQKSPDLDERCAEVIFVDGTTLLVRQTLDQILIAAGVVRPPRKPVETAG